MEHIGYSVVDVENNEEIWFAGDTWQRCPGFPAFINVPNLGQVHCPTLNETYSGYKLVMRFIEDGSKEKITVHEDKVVVTRPLGE